MKHLQKFESISDKYEIITKDEVEQYVKKFGREIFTNDEINLIVYILDEVKKQDIGATLGYLSWSEFYGWRKALDLEDIEGRCTAVRFYTSNQYICDIEKLGDDWFLVEWLYFKEDDSYERCFILCDELQTAIDYTKNFLISSIAKQ